MAFHPWSQITYSVGKATDNILSSRGFYARFDRSNDGVLIYRSRGNDMSVGVFALKRLGFQLAEHYVDIATDIASRTVNDALHILGHRKSVRAIKKAKEDSLARHQELLENQKSLQKIREKQAANYTEIINRGTPTNSQYGNVPIADNSSDNFVAVDPYGKKVQEALMMYFDTEHEMETELVVFDPKTQAISKKTVKTKRLCFWDVNAKVSQSTTKNVVLTKVQGRDFSRKELVSGGDISFNIDGAVNSNLPGVYPEEEVKKLIELGQYNGIVRVNHILFKQFGVEYIIIQDFKLETQEFKNEQPYSMSCVAVEPSDEVKVQKDTIQLVNDLLATSGSDVVFQSLLQEKRMQIISGDSNKTTDKGRRIIRLSNKI